MNSLFYTYILRCREGKFYIGSAEDIEKRLLQHNSSENFGWTRKYRDWKVIYSEAFSTRKEALVREKQIKSYKGWRAFQALIENTYS